MTEGKLAKRSTFALTSNYVGLLAIAGAPHRHFANIGYLVGFS